jgi:2-polyprenyl-6-methoxyphenol hydroxylase-like FAD-dependent oxidoreductase
VATKDFDAPVLIAGGGLVGLSAAMFLAQHGVAATIFERLRGVSALPRAAHFHLRTLGLFRSAGIEDEVRAQTLVLARYHQPRAVVPQRSCPVRMTDHARQLLHISRKPRFRIICRSQSHPSPLCSNPNRSSYQMVAAPHSSHTFYQ